MEYSRKLEVIETEGSMRYIGEHRKKKESKELSKREVEKLHTKLIKPHLEVLQKMVVFPLISPTLIPREYIYAFLTKKTIEELYAKVHTELVKSYLEALQKMGWMPLLIGPKKKPEEVINIERRLEEILTKPELLSYEDLSFIAKEILPFSLRISPEYLKKLEAILHRDLSIKKDMYRVGALNPLDEIKDIQYLDTSTRIEKYLRAELLSEFLIKVQPIENEFENGRIRYEDYHNRVTDLWNEIMKHWLCK